MLYVSGRDLLRIARDPFDAAVAIGFLAALAGTLIHGIGANTFIIVRIMEPFWLLAGLTVVLLSINEQEIEQEQEHEAMEATNGNFDALLPDAHHARS